MAGTFTGNALADGFVANALGTIYTVPGSTVAFIKKMSFTNINAATQTVEVYLRIDGATDRLFRRFTLAQYESFEIADVILGAADLVRALTTTSSAVNYSLHGVLET